MRPTPVARELFKQRMKEIAPFVSFSYDLRKNPTPYQMRKAREYYHEIEAHLYTVNMAVPVPKKIKSKVLKNFGYKKTGYKAVPHRPPASIVKAVKFSDEGHIITETKFLEYSFVPFDRKKLARNGEQYLEDFFNGKNAGNKFELVVGGEGHGVVGNGFTQANRVKKEALELMQRYSPGGRNFKITYRTSRTGKKYRTTNHYKHWLAGTNELHIKKGGESNVRKLNKELYNAKNTSKELKKELDKRNKKARTQKRKNKK